MECPLSLRTQAIYRSGYTFDHADRLRSALPVRGPRHPRAPHLPHGSLAADARRPGLPAGRRVASWPHHRPQRPARRQPEGRGTGHTASARFGPGEAARGRLYLRIENPRHGDLRQGSRRHAERARPARRRPPLGHARGREERAPLPEPGAARGRESRADLHPLPRPVRADAGLPAPLRRPRCGLLLEKLPLADSRDADGWNRITQLASTLELDETRDAQPYDLLTRVFPEELMRVFRLYAVEYHCPYDEEKVKDMLRGLGRREVESILAEQGEVVIRNEMCNHEYRFDARAIAELFH